MLCIAMKSHNRGAFYIAEALPYRDIDIANLLHRPIETVQLAIETFMRLGMIVPDENGAMEIPDFDNQMGILGVDEKRESAKKRVEAYRERKKQLKIADNSTNNDVTRNSNACNATDIEYKSIRVKDKRVKDKDHEQHALIAPELPHGEVFSEAWSQWVTHRKEKKARLTPTSIKAQIAKLSNVAESEAVAIIRQSIENGWTGLFEIKKQFNKQNAGNLEIDCGF
jgi:hypothetical protein